MTSLQHHDDEEERTRQQQWAMESLAVPSLGATTYGSTGGRIYTLHHREEEAPPSSYESSSSLYESPRPPSTTTTSTSYLSSKDYDVSPEKGTPVRSPERSPERSISTLRLGEKRRASLKQAYLVHGSDHKHPHCHPRDLLSHVDTEAPTTPPIRLIQSKKQPDDILSPLTPHNKNNNNNNNQRPLFLMKSISSLGGGSENVYTQSLLLGFAFMAIWSPQNIMAPNLTAMARDFGFTPAQRDLYLGSNIALATGVLSLPISAGIGFLTDFWNRKYLFCATVTMGGLASLGTSLCTTYWWLFFARFVNGGCMSGSVPIAFSLLGDLFDTNERNAASSGLTAMMGMGIIIGQVYAGMVGPSLGWAEPFVVSSVLTLVAALLVFVFVKEPIRGGKEEVLQDMLKQGTRYDRKLTWKGFINAMKNNRSNVLLMWQGFFSSIPWGIIFVFLNDYLAVNRGLGVRDATLLVAVFGVGCAVGGILGGWWGQKLQCRNVAYLPLFMAGTTFVGIFPFFGLLDSHFPHGADTLAVLYAFLGGCIESLPSVNVRPCLINVNPPETRGAALTAANLIINVARGVGPSFITLMAAIWNADRQLSFNVTLAVFWVITSIQLLFLARTLPMDQDAMDNDLAQYAASAVEQARRIRDVEQESSIVSIEDRITSFGHEGIRESMRYLGCAIREIGPRFCAQEKEETVYETDDNHEDSEEEPFTPTNETKPMKRMWPNEESRLVSQS